MLTMQLKNSKEGGVERTRSIVRTYLCDAHGEFSGPTAGHFVEKAAS